MGQDLDAIRELLEDFATDLRRANRAKSTIDKRDVGYFVEYLEAQVPPAPATAEALTRVAITVDFDLPKYKVQRLARTYREDCERRAHQNQLTLFS